MIIKEKINNNKIFYKNKNYRNNLKNIRKNYSSEVGNNIRTNIGFSYTNNNIANSSFNKGNNNITNPLKKDKNKNTLDSSYKIDNYDYTKNLNMKKNLERLDNNISVNEKIISSPFQALQTYQKDKKEADIKYNSSLNTGKKVLFDIKINYKNANKNNYQNGYFNIRGKEAQILQNLIHNLQSNIPDYDNNFVTEKELKELKNKK